MHPSKLLPVALACLLLLIQLPSLSAKDPARIPPGAKTLRAAAEQFFKAYKAHDGKAAAEVAADGPVKELLATRGASSDTSLQLMDDTHIYYVGGSIEMKIVKNAAGRWYVKSLVSTAD